MIVEWAKDHPVAAGGGALVVFLLLYMVLSGGSSAAVPAASASTGVNADLQAMEIQSASQLQLGQLALQASDNRAMADYKIAALGADAGLKAKYADNDTAKVINAQNVDLGKWGISAQQALGVAQLKQVTDVTGINAAVSMAQIGAARDTSIAQTNAMAQISNNSTAAALEQSRLQAQTQQKKDGGSLFGDILGIGASILGFL